VKVTLFQYVVWVATFAANIILLFVLIYRKAISSFPLFFSWIGFVTLRTAVLFELHAKGMDKIYADIYWYGQIPEMFLMLGTAGEIVRHVLMPENRWSWGVRKPFVLLMIGAVLLAVIITAATHPFYPHTFLRWLYPSNLFCSALSFELGVAIVITANRFGLAWRNRVTGLAIGWMVWSFVTCLAEATRSYLPGSHLIVTMNQLRIYSYLAAVVMWISAFWRHEPERKPMTAEMYALFSSTFVELSKDVEREKLS